MRSTPGVHHCAISAKPMESLAISSTHLMSTAVKMSLAEHSIAQQTFSVLSNPAGRRSIARDVKDDLNPPRVVLILCA